MHLKSIKSNVILLNYIIIIKVIVMHYILLKHCNFFVQPSEDVTCVVRATNAKIHVDTKHTLLWRRLDELLQNILQCQVCKRIN